MSSTKFTVTVDPTIPPEPKDSDATETEEDEKSESAELPENSRISKKFQDEPEDEEETEEDEDEEEEEEDKKTRKVYTKKNKPKHLFREPLDRPQVIVNFQDLLRKFQLKNWKPDWQEWKQVKEFTKKNTTFCQETQTEIIRMIDALEQTDKYMIGIRTYIYVLCCQLNEAVTPFKRKYVDAYVVFCKFMQLEMKKEKKSKDNDYPYAAVGTNDIEKKIIKRYFEAKSSETKFQPFTTIAENPNIEDTATTAVQTFLDELTSNTKIAYSGNASNIKGCAKRVKKPKFQLYNADSEEIPEEIAKIDNNDDGSGSEGEPYRQVYEESDDENVNVPETEISQMPKFKPDPEINVPDRPIGTFAEEIEDALG